MSTNTSTFLRRYQEEMKMSQMKNVVSTNVLVLATIMFTTMLSSVVVVDGYAYSPVAAYKPSAWKGAHATFYGDETASETMGGACGYGNLFDSGYGIQTAALSSVLFNNGKACGSCYQLKCVTSKWCYKNIVIKITATNLCPPNWYKPTDNGGWCNPPRHHFDLSKPIFMKFAQWKAGIVPVSYRRVPCVAKGGIRFKLTGNPYWLLVFVTNVGGPGDISQMWVKGSKTPWMSMTRNWGASFQVFTKLGGQALSFKIKSGSGSQTIISNNVTPAYWSTGKTYQATNNFR